MLFQQVSLSRGWCIFTVWDRINIIDGLYVIECQHLSNMFVFLENDKEVIAVEGNNNTTGLSLCLSDCLSVSLFVWLSVCLSFFLSVCLSLCLSVCLLTLPLFKNRLFQLPPYVPIIPGCSLTSWIDRSLEKYPSLCMVQPWLMRVPPYLMVPQHG